MLGVTKWWAGEGGTTGLFGSSAVVLRAGRNYEKGEEFLVSYGPKGAAGYLEENGCARQDWLTVVFRGFDKMWGGIYWGMGIRLVSTYVFASFTCASNRQDCPNRFSD